MEIIEFDLPLQDLQNSNDAFRSYVQALRGTKTKEGSGNAGVTSKEDRLALWAKLIRAQQYAYHPSLVDIMKIERDAILAGVYNNNEAMDVGDEDDAEAQEVLRG